MNVTQITKLGQFALDSKADEIAMLVRKFMKDEK